MGIDIATEFTCNAQLEIPQASLHKMSFSSLNGKFPRPRAPGSRYALLISVVKSSSHCC